MVKFQEQRLFESLRHIPGQYIIARPDGMPPPRQGNCDMHILFGNNVQGRYPNIPRINLRTVRQRLQYPPPRIDEYPSRRSIAHDNNTPMALIPSPPVMQTTIDLLLPQTNQLRHRNHAQH
eukprot:403343_1